MRAMHSSSVAPLLLGIAGGAAGLVLGARIGYEIDYANDVQRGCEDCGLGGMIVGAATGLPAGVAGGVLIGSAIVRHHQRAEAIRRIKAKRG
jgi:hypothetical protein